MKAIFNSRLIEIDSQVLNTKNRAFCYGDGLFETIVTGPHRINLTDFHLERLTRACKVLDLDSPQFSNQNLREMTSQLADINQLNGDTRARLQIWREDGGLYSPQLSSYSFLLQVAETTTPAFGQGGSIGISTSSKTSHNAISFAKTMSALPYVLAGIEMRQKKLDEIILLDDQGNLSETHSSNLFWIEANEIFTPSLQSGCVEGVMRRLILETLKVNEVMYKPERLTLADSVFSSNASGIRYFTSFENKRYLNPKEKLRKVLKLLQHL
ncbi:aminotransferase class IV [Roseivirga sp.]|uniref:aminotransferase class IV n=1 Tax=Roseivirga sp. TaxID=1964215 RepID=UPI002B2763D0|nr:aminotransferase class IV [Roseivirga sp.]